MKVVLEDRKPSPITAGFVRAVMANSERNHARWPPGWRKG
jgi:hypothetical protein